MINNSATRLERDSMGEMPVPASALYGASTQRAVINFPISGRPMPEGFIRAMGLIKYACATANENLGLLSKNKADYIRQGAMAVFEGKLNQHFPVDVFQTGSCTSSNMNVNEVIANYISQKEGKSIGSKEPLHPNDDVNKGQSSNDTMPSVLHLSVALAIKSHLIPALANMASVLDQKTKAWKDCVKIGRTHLMDATPLTMGQVFSGYTAQIKKAIKRSQKAIEALQELAIGGTAVGTGINCHKDFAKAVCQELSKETGIPFREADNHFEAQAGRDDAVEVAGYLSTIAASLTKIASDIRLLGSGPRCGIGELLLPSTQPGSSIMPGKVNPVMCEMLIQVCIYTQGLCQMVNICGRDGHFELNVTIPLIAYALLESIQTLSNGINVFTKNCLDGLEIDVARCQELVNHSLMLVTALNPYIGYDKAAHVAKRAYKENKTLREIALEEGLMSNVELDKALDPASMV